MPEGSSTQNAALERTDITDVTQSLHDFLWEKHRKAYEYAWLLSFILFLGLSALLYYAYQAGMLFDSYNNVDLRILIVPLLPFTIPGLIRNYYRKKLQHQFMAGMAQALGFAYAPSIDMKELEGALFTVGSSHEALDAISGTYKSYPIRIFDYHYWVSRGKSRVEIKNTVFQLMYTSSLPHVLVNPPESGNDMFTGSPTKGLEEVKLEGDFSAHAKVYTTHDAQIQVREIFQPDVMQEWINVFAAAHFETASNSVVIMLPGDIDNKSRFLSMRDMMDHLLDDILPGLRSAASDTVGTTPLVVPAPQQ